MKPVYETERRSGKTWILVVALFVGFLFAGGVLLVFMETAVAQQAIVAADARAALELAQLRVQPEPAVVIAAPATHVQKCEYKLLPAISESGLNSLAKEGWEVVCTYGQNTAILKRPLQAAAGAATYVPLDVGPAPTRVPASPPESDKRLLPLYRDPTK